jgi:Xaa-Pro dipeptidase
LNFELSAIQSALREFGFDAWLLGDFRGSNVLARRVLGIPDDTMGSRRWHYLIPANGEPQKLVHRIESSMLDHLPGEKTVYLKWQEWDAGVTKLASSGKKIAMEYSPRNANPYISRVDAGTLEVVRAAGAEVLSSGNLIQLFEATWDDAQWQMHLEAATHTNSAYDRAWKFIADEVRSSGSVRETQVQQLIMDHFAENGLTTYHPPIVGANAHSGDPHFETCTATDVAIREGDFVLIDLWAKLNKPRAVYSDLTRTGFVGQTVPEKYEKIFRIVAAARDAAIAKVRDHIARGEPLAGWQVDAAAREVIVAAGYGEYFVHRLGHSIGQEVHGNGANMDGLETREDRLVLPRCCFSIEPGIYLPEFGVRSEVDVFVDANRQVHVTGGALQTGVVPILR